ncbi:MULTISPECIES: hypothetical protein [unclassified Streptomyces]|uniref:hypothetical protein n=1 Tax=unclassified Streptomyces TaxID=2593676 RepID=UPI0004CC2B27|nr:MULTISPECIES: hypothetical protein [unclassified Streptomyces]KOV73377.1 hypothetical protein ADL02_40085 [Streptomyces sp. NRRL WC-3723]
MLKYTLHVRDFTVQAAHLTSEPAAAGAAQTPTVDDPRNPTRVTVHTDTGAAAALRIAQRHLNLVHARLAYSNPGAVDRTATDIVYAEARSRAEALTAEQRRQESYYALHSEDDALRMDALTDVMEEHGELDA